MWVHGGNRAGRVVLTTLFRWWWAESLAALVFLVWLAQETRETFEEAREERSS